MTGARVWFAAGALLLAAAFSSGCGAENGPAKNSSAVAKPAATPAPPRTVKLVWPTPNDAFMRGEALEKFIQPTASGEVLSGTFGSVRSGGRQFHEGIDLFPLERDKRGESLDPVFAAMAGVVRHISEREGASSYGRYIVLEHPEESPPVYTLYAHLTKAAPGLRVGQRVAAGDTLGVLGRSAGGYSIPKDRAHLHFEIGVRMTDRFQDWYRARGFGSPNEHGVWNGMNLMGLDPLEFFARAREGNVRRLDDVFARQPTAVRLRVANAQEPDFARRYPTLATGPEPAAGWELDVSASGAPLRLRRLPAGDMVGWKRGEARIIAADSELLRANRGRQLVRTVKGAPTPGEDLNTVLEQLWGGRR